MNPQLVEAEGAFATTSAEGAMRDAGGPWLTDVWTWPPATSGTVGPGLPLEDRVGFPADSDLTGTSASASAEPEHDPLDTAAAISELRRLAGLTWEQLARVFGAARRSLHFWASGKPMNAANEEHLRRLLAVLRQADRGSAPENRAMLLRDHRGTIPIDLLASHRYDEFIRVVGKGPGRRSIDLKALSREAQEAHKPLPPEELVDALHDRVHRDVGRGRAARTARSKRRGPGG